MTKRITVVLTEQQAIALRLAADYILWTGEGAVAQGFSRAVARALENADNKIADAAGWKRGALG